MPGRDKRITFLSFARRDFAVRMAGLMLRPPERIPMPLNPTPDSLPKAAHVPDLWLAASECLAQAIARHSPAVFTTSLGLEDMVVLDLISRAGLEVDVVTLDTGRLHDETHALIDTARSHYRRPIRALHPQADALETFTALEGSNPFYRSIELRKRCCDIRKLEPLSRALQSKALWITGLRRAQSGTRTGIEVLEFDTQRNLHKLNPLADWSTQQVLDYIVHHAIPVNPLHARGFPSIGCAPCTRAVQQGEDERAGRWWWEQADTRECGLHVAPDGRLVRSRSSSTHTAAGAV